MALTLKGEQTIGTKFAADVSRLRLIGVKIPNDYAGFVGMFNALSDLETAYPPQSQASTTLAGVRTSADNEFQYYMVSTAGTEIKYWLKIQNVYPLRGDTHDHLSDEEAWDSEIQTDVNLDPVTLAFTQPTQVGEHLTLAANYHFAINLDESNYVAIIVQGLKFLKEDVDPPYAGIPYYYWGLGTDKWAAFSEDGEYVVTNWTLEV